MGLERRGQSRFRVFVNLDAGVHFFGLGEGGEGDSGEDGRGRAAGDAPADGFVERLSCRERPYKSRGERVSGTDGADRVYRWRGCFYYSLAGGCDGAAAAAGHHHGFGSHGYDALGGFAEMGLGDEGAVEQALGFGLVGRHGRGTGFEAVEQGVAVDMEERLYVCFLG